MFSPLLSVLLICNRRILRHRGKFSKVLCSCQAHFSDGNQTVCLTLKNKSLPPIMPKQRERCLDFDNNNRLNNSFQNHSLDILCH
jgi:hypothetical protein